MRTSILLLASCLVLLASEAFAQYGPNYGGPGYGNRGGAYYPNANYGPDFAPGNGAFNPGYGGYAGGQCGPQPRHCHLPRVTQSCQPIGCAPLPPPAVVYRPYPVQPYCGGCIVRGYAVGSAYLPPAVVPVPGPPAVLPVYPPADYIGYSR